MNDVVTWLLERSTQNTPMMRLVPPRLLLLGVFVFSAYCSYYFWRNRYTQQKEKYGNKTDS